MRIPLLLPGVQNGAESVADNVLVLQADRRWSGARRGMGPPGSRAVRVYEDFVRVYEDFVQVYEDFVRVYEDFVRVYEDFVRVYEDFVRVYEDFVQVYEDFVQVYGAGGRVCEERVQVSPGVERWAHRRRGAGPLLSAAHTIQDLAAADIESLPGENGRVSGPGGQRIDLTGFSLIARFKHDRFARIVADEEVFSRQAEARIDIGR